MTWTPQTWPVWRCSPPCTTLARWTWASRPRHGGTRTFPKTKLAGDLLVNGRCKLKDIEELADGVLQGYSAALNLFIRWEQGRLAWHDPATCRHILTYDDQSARADNAQSLA